MLLQKIHFKIVLSKINLKNSSKQFKVTNHCCCLTENLTRRYLVCQKYIVIFINNINNVNENT